MERIYSGYEYSNGAKLYYSIINEDGKENGFDIYIGDSVFPFMHQPEPFIPNPSKSYAENAIEICAGMSAENSTPDDGVHVKSLEERITDVEANVDYLMLLNDADSATEEETE